MNYFGIVDYVVLGVTLLISLLIGVYFTYTANKTNEDLLVGGRNLGVFPVACSLMVSYFSAITILGYSAEIFYFGTQVFLMQFVTIVAVALSCVVFIPFFHELKLTSVFEYLGLRFQSIALRRIATLIFLFQQLVILAVILYAPSIAVEHFFGFPMQISIISIGVIATIYTSFGGLKAVIWSDVFQFFMIIFGICAIIVRGLILSGGVREAYKTSWDFDRIELFDFEFNPFQDHNFWNIVFGYGAFCFLHTGVDQRFVQRYGSMSTKKRAFTSIMASVPLKFIVHLLCLIMGLAIFAVYAECDPLLRGDIKKPDEIVPYFVSKELVAYPGVLGLFSSCIFSAVLSSISSSINSMVAVTWKDFFSNCSFTKDMSEKSQTNISRFIGISFGIVSIVLAFLPQYLGAIWTGVWKAVSPMHGVLGGTFILALFVPFANKYGAFFGILTSLTTMIFISVQSFLVKNNPRIPLRTTIDNCHYDMTMNYTVLWDKVKIANVEDTIDWPEKIYSLSYTLYLPLGVIITVFVGILFSLLTGGISQVRTINEDYPWVLHPWVRSKSSVLKKRRESYISVQKALNESRQSLDKLVSSSKSPTTSSPSPRQENVYETLPISDNDNDNIDK